VTDAFQQRSAAPRTLKRFAAFFCLLEAAPDIHAFTFYLHHHIFFAQSSYSALRRDRPNEQPSKARQTPAHFLYIITLFCPSFGCGTTPQARRREGVY